MHDFQSPGSHANRLAAMSPKPRIESVGACKQKWEKGQLKVGGTRGGGLSQYGGVYPANENPDRHEYQ